MRKIFHCILTVAAMLCKTNTCINLNVTTTLFYWAATDKENITLLTKSTISLSSVAMFYVPSMCSRFIFLTYDEVFNSINVLRRARWT